MDDTTIDGYENPMPGQKLYHVDFQFKNGQYEGTVDESCYETDLNNAKVISSEIVGKPGFHKILLDIDFPVKVIPSSTEGHFHLYIDKEVSWEHYVALMNLLAGMGIIEHGYVSAAVRRGGSHLRLPWIKKIKDDAIKHVREFFRTDSNV